VYYALATTHHDGERMESKRGFSVYIADDPISVIGLSSLFEGRVVGSASDGLQALNELLEQQPSIAIIGACLPELPGEQIVRRLHEAEAVTKPIIATCACHTFDFVEAISNGLMGFMSKSSPESVRDTVQRVAQGETVLQEIHSKVVGALREKNQPCKLTPREREILTYMADGLTTKAIAGEIYIAEPTIKFHIRNIYSKLGVHNKGAAVHAAMQQGLID
jgi:two-component system nitrate/nitrite response regulator NarL